MRCPYCYHVGDGNEVIDNDGAYPTGQILPWRNRRFRGRDNEDSANDEEDT